jgi:murein DD-endopeptidase MepM/ murein hydrolase activator NlpD
MIHPSGKARTRLHFSKWTGGLALVAAFGLLIVLSILIEDYLCLRNKSAKYRELKKVIQQQNEDILDKQKQIELFTAKIDVLKSNIVGLKKLENEIKTMTQVKKSVKRRNNKQDYTESESLFGIGGSYDEDASGLEALEVGPNGLAREINHQVENLYLASINQKQSLEDLLDSLKDRQNILASLPSLKPCQGNFSSSFGRRISPFKHSGEFHKGVDISNKKGTKILATGDGVVTFMGNDGLFGKMVILDHGYGLVTKYAHLSKILVEKGDFVKKGSVIALMGNTGRTTGSHLHYEVLLNGIHVNPLNYMHN